MKKKRTLKPGRPKRIKAKRVEVVWNDATGYSGWHTADEAMPMTLVTMHTVGYLLETTKEYIKLVRSLEDKAANVGDVFIIPRAWIKRLTHI